MPLLRALANNLHCLFVSSPANAPSNTTGVSSSSSSDIGGGKGSNSAAADAQLPACLDASLVELRCSGLGGDASHHIEGSSSCTARFVQLSNSTMAATLAWAVPPLHLPTLYASPPVLALLGDAKGSSGRGSCGRWGVRIARSSNSTAGSASDPVAEALVRASYQHYLQLCRISDQYSTLSGGGGGGSNRPSQRDRVGGIASASSLPLPPAATMAALSVSLTSLSAACSYDVLGELARKSHLALAAGAYGHLFGPGSVVQRGEIEDALAACIALSA